MPTSRMTSRHSAPARQTFPIPSKCTTTTMTTGHVMSIRAASSLLRGTHQYQCVSISTMRKKMTRVRDSSQKIYREGREAPGESGFIFSCLHSSLFLFFSFLWLWLWGDSQEITTGSCLERAWVSSTPLLRRVLAAASRSMATPILGNSPSCLMRGAIRAAIRGRAVQLLMATSRIIARVICLRTGWWPWIGAAPARSTLLRAPTPFPNLSFWLFSFFLSHLSPISYTLTARSPVLYTRK